MTKVPKNKGSYTKRASNDSWQVKYPLGWNEAKKAYDEYREEVGSEAEAIAAIKDINTFIYHGGYVNEIPIHRKKVAAEEDSNQITFQTFVDEFCKTREAQSNLAARTTESDRSCLNRVMPYLGKLPLKSISPRDIDLAYASLRSGKTSGRNGKPYSGTTLHKTHAALSMLFDKAVDYEYIPHNPCTKVEKPRRDTKEKQSLSPEQAQALFNFIVAERLSSKSVGVLLSLMCGLRLSEMMALLWNDFSGGVINVNKSQQKDQQTAKKTKNEENRLVPCPPPLIPVLEKWRTQQKTWYKANDLQWSESVPIVNSKVGNHILQRSFTRWFDIERKRYPIPDDFSFHGLRHTYVTLLRRDCGIDDRTAQGLSGHKSNQAFQIYSHTNDEWKREGASRLGALIAPREDFKCCQNCSSWSVSPHDLSIGACWVKGENSLAVSGAAHRCDLGSFVKAS